MVRGVMFAAIVVLLAGCEGTGNGTTADGACALVSGSLIITELFPNPSSTDDGKEWFEVYNPTDVPVSLTGVTFRSGSGTTPKVHQVPMALDTPVPAHGFITIGNGVMGSESGIPTYSWPQLVLSNTAGLIVILCGDVEIDQVAYGKDVAGPGEPSEGVSMQLAASLIAPGMSANVNDVPGNWCASPADAVFDEAGSLGTPGAANGACPIVPVPGQCTENETPRPVVKPQAGQLLVTEVFANNDGTDDPAKEWLEIRTLAAFDLNGLAFEHTTGTTVRRYEVVSEACLPVAAEQYLVMGGSLDPLLNGGVQAMTYAFADGLTLYNTAGTLTVKDYEDTVLTTAIHPTSVSGVSVQLKPGLESDANAPADVNNWCKAATTGVFEGMGSPGAANGDCGT